jgi:hypothetical protein
VDFCARTFCADGIYSAPDLSDVNFTTAFDVIWVGSLFTHVDSGRAERWLRHLCNALAPDGILVATFHGMWSIEVHNSYERLIGSAEWAKILLEFRATGWGYAEYSEDVDYGVSLCRPSRVIDMASAIEGIRIISYTERGWAGNHDVLTLARSDRAEPF